MVYAELLRLEIIQMMSDIRPKQPYADVIPFTRRTPVAPPLSADPAFLQNRNDYYCLHLRFSVIENAITIWRVEGAWKLLQTFSKYKLEQFFGCKMTYVMGRLVGWQQMGTIKMRAIKSSISNIFKMSAYSSAFVVFVWAIFCAFAVAVVELNAFYGILFHISCVAYWSELYGIFQVVCIKYAMLMMIYSFWAKFLEIVQNLCIALIEPLTLAMLALHFDTQLHIAIGKNMHVN